MAREFENAKGMNKIKDSTYIDAQTRPWLSGLPNKINDLPNAVRDDKRGRTYQIDKF